MNHSTIICVATLFLGIPSSSAFAEVSAPEETSEASTLEALVAQLQSPEPALRVAAAQALEHHGAAAVPYLISTLQGDPDPVVRGWAARSLASIGTPEATNALQSAARTDTDERVRQVASESLGSSSTQPQQTPFPPAQAPEPASATSASVSLRVQTAPAAPESTTDLLALRRARRGRTLMIVGWSVFGGSYATSLLAGGMMLDNDADGAWWLFVPIIGPAVYGTKFMGYADDAWIFGPIVYLLGVVFWIETLVQIGGLSLAITGHVRRSRSQTQAVATERRRPRRLSFAFVGPAGPGFTLAGRF